MSVTIKDISWETGVSIATVSKVLNGDYSRVSEETRKRILHVAAELDYRPNLLARNLARSKNTLIGLIVPDIANPYYAEMCRGISDEAMRSGYVAMIANTDSDSSRALGGIRTMAEYIVGGVLLIGDALHVDDNVRLLQRYRVPYLCVDNYKQGMQYCVYGNDRAGSLTAVRHLIGRGHTRIAFLSGAAPGEADERLRGYEEALREHRLAVDPSLIVCGRYTLDSGYRGTQSLLDQRVPFTAIACGNDLIAFGALKAIHEHGLRVPQDLSLVGFDDMYLSGCMAPGLTTMRQPAYEMGACAMRMLACRINKTPMETTTRSFEPILVERDT